MKKILVVDDDKSVVLLVSQLLKDAGYSTIPAYDGEEAQALIQSDQPDLAVLDIMMPKLNGSTLCGILKFDEATQAMPVVLVTTKDSPVDKEVGRMVKADAYLTKPINTNDLLETIKRLCPPN